MSRHAVLASAAIVLLALAGCAPVAPERTPSGSATPPAAEPTTTTPTPDAAALTIPDCEQLLPLTEARALFSDATEYLGELPKADFGSGSFEIPAIQATLLGASPSRQCWWGVPNSDGSFALVVAEIAPADRASLVSALAGAGFATSTSGAITTLELEQEGMISTDAASHLFSGDLWILCDGTSLSLTGGAALSALTAIRAANPSLGL